MKKKIFFVIIVIVLVIIFLYFANIWKNRIKSRSILEGPGDSNLENLLYNFINGLITYLISNENDKEFLDWKKYYPELEILEKNWKKIRDEALNISNDSPEYGNIDDKNKNLSFSDKAYWKVFILKYYKNYINKNCDKVQNTCILLKKLKKLNLAMFSILEKGKIIKKHRGPYRGIMRIHLPLKIPKHNKSFIEVNGKKHYWKEGEIVAIDDTFVHCVSNPSKLPNSDERIILFIDLPRKDIPSIFNQITKLSGSYFNKVNNKIEKKSKN